MQAPSNQNATERKSCGSGVARVAIWKDSEGTVKLHDVFTTYSQGVFYDFAKPIQLLDGYGWNSAIRTDDADGFFTITSI